jgi:division protein CdvB (Snf7/Vps24/ESCRT-III family)
LHRSRSFDGISEVISRGDSNPDATVEAGVLEAVDQEAASVIDAVSVDVAASVNGLPGRSVDVSGFNDVVARSSGSGYRPADSDISA